MKNLALLLALVFGLAFPSRAQIFVDFGSFPFPLTFDSAPALLAVEWASSTNAIPGNGTTFTTAVDVSNAVQNISQSSVFLPLERITANSTFEAARHNTAAGYVITQPTTVGVGVLKATLRNATSEAFSHINVNFNFGVLTNGGGESAPGHQVFFSTNGQAGSWRLIPAFSGLSAPASVNATIFLGRWMPNTDIFLLWADDNAPTNSENGYTVDNFSLNGIVTTNVPIPLSMTLIAPAHGTVVFTPVTAHARAVGDVAVTNVSFYTNGLLAAVDTQSLYSAVLSGLTSGTNTIYARAINATGSVYSATNTVRVRPEFAEYTGGTYQQSFDSMGTTGTETPTGWYGGVTLPAMTIDVSPGDGSSLPQAAVIGWNYGTTGSGDRALGTSPTAGERNLVLRLRNNSGSTINSFNLLYDGEVWRNYTSVTGGWLTNYYSINRGATWIPTPFHFQQPFASVAPQTSLDGNLPENRTANIGGIISPVAPVFPDSVIYFRWHDFNETNTDGALALDNVRFTATLLSTITPCSGDIVLSTNMTTCAGTNGWIQNGGLASSCGSFPYDNTMSFRITPLTNVAGMASISTTGSTYDTVIAVYLSPASFWDPPTILGCSSNGVVHFETPLGAAKEYWLAVNKPSDGDTLQLTYGYESLIFPPVANDICANAISIYGSTNFSMNTANATSVEDPIPSCGTNSGRGVWFRYTFPFRNFGASGNLKLSTCGSDFDTVIQVYQGNCPQLFQAQCNDNAAACGALSSQSEVTVQTTSGNSYLIWVGGSGGATGNLNLNATLCEGPSFFGGNIIAPVELVPGGIRVSYQAFFNGTPPFNYSWDIGGFLTNTTSSIVSRDYGLFDTVATSFTVRAVNACGGNVPGTGGGPPPCGAICLSIGSTATHTTDNGGGAAYELNTACGILDSGLTKWFRLGADQSAAGLAYLSISNSSPDTMITVYSGFIIDSSLLVELDCATNSGPKRVARFETRPGINYYVAARSASLSNLNIRHGYELVPPAPTNDTCEAATIMTNGLTYYTNTLNAIAFESPPAAGCVPSFGRGVWYSYFANTTGPVLVNTCGSDFDTALQVYTGSCGALTPVAGGCTNNTSLRCPDSNRAGLRFNAVSGETYRILVGGASEAAGNLVISATPCTAPVITTFTSIPQLVTNGVRVSYQADFIGNTPYGWRWSFNDGQVFTTTSNGLTRLFGPFQSFPSSVTVSATNFCGTNTGTFPLSQPCGALCLAAAVGTNLVHAGTTGSGLKTGSQNATCGNFPPASTLWFRLTTLTNASGLAVISSAGSGFDTRLGVFRGTSNALAEVTCNDNFNGTLQSQVEFETRASTNYWLAVNASEGAPLVLTYGYPVSFASVVLTNVGVNRALDLRTLPLPSFQYRLRGGTNLGLPVANWSNLITTNFSNSVSASTNILRYRDTNVPLLQQRYYRIERVP